jgi:hypothetical protein
MKKLYTACNLIEANTLQAMMQSQGIKVFLKGEALAGALGELPATVAQVELWVDRSHWSLAQQLLDDYHHADQTGVHWCCEYCGEENPPGFELCWQCQKELR